MAFIRVPDPNLNTGKPGRSTDMKRMRDNQDDFDARIQTLEDGTSRIANHFNRVHGLANQRILFNQTGTALWEDFIFETIGAATTSYVLEPALATDDHFITMSAKSGVETNMWGMPWFYFDNMTKPITCIIRLESNLLYDQDQNFLIGLCNLTLGGVNPTDGVFLQKDGASTTHLKFTTERASAQTHGTPFDSGDDAPAINTMFEVKIVMDEGANRADCYMNGVLKSTLSGANLPVDRALHPCVINNPSGTEQPIFKIDKVVAMAGGPVVDLV